MMKKLLFTLMAGLLTVVASANGNAGFNASVLNLQVFDNHQFIINLDGTKYHPPTTTKKITNLTPGNHYLKVVTVEDICTPQGTERVRTVIFDGNINLPARSRVRAKVGRHGNLRFLNVTAMNGFGGHGQGTGPANCGNPNGNQAPVGYTMPTQVVQTNGGNGGSCGQGGFVAAGMQPSVFNGLVHTINRTSFDSDKLGIAKQYVAMHGVSSHQLASLMNLLTYESSKVELAKFGYNHTVDRGNFFVINNSLTFSSSINEVNNYVFASY